MMVERLRTVAPLALMLAILPAAGPVACGSSEPGGPDPCACTEEFRSFTVKLVDSEGSALRGVSFDVTILRTGEKVNVVEWVPGVYTVFDDNFTGQILPNEVIRVTAIKDATIATRDFIFTVDEPCRCHVQKVSGPDVIVLDSAGD
jgi:hypothetical protein